jgi:hypothetical protein
MQKLAINMTTKAKVLQHKRTENYLIRLSESPRCPLGYLRTPNTKELTL